MPKWTGPGAFNIEALTSRLTGLDVLLGVGHRVCLNVDKMKVTLTRYSEMPPESDTKKSGDGLKPARVMYQCKGCVPVSRSYACSARAE
jgi:hypothetical protein